MKKIAREILKKMEAMVWEGADGNDDFMSAYVFLAEAETEFQLKKAIKFAEEEIEAAEEELGFIETVLLNNGTAGYSVVKEAANTVYRCEKFKKLFKELLEVL